MKKINLLFLLFLLIFLNCTDASNRDQELIKEFLIACKSKMSLTELKTNFLYKMDAKNELKDFDTYLNQQLNLLTSDLQRKSIQNIVILKYSELPESEQNFLLKKEKSPNIYSVKFNNRTIRNFLIENGKISSFITINKGGIRNFLVFCPE